MHVCQLFSLRPSAVFIGNFVQLVKREHEQVGVEFKQLDKRHEGEAEPQSEHSAEIRYVLDHLHTKQTGAQATAAIIQGRGGSIAVSYTHLTLPTILRV